jgi:site-specific DNA-methyltransferase (adenine-specific)
MKPYFQDDSVTIYHGDALEAIQCLSLIDALIMDPPYCSGGFSEAGRKRATGQGLRSETIREQGWFIGDNMGTAGIAWLLRSVTVQAFPLLADGGSVCCFTDWRMVSNLGPAIESSGLRWQNLVVWDKKSAGLGTGFRAQHEMILHYVKGTGVFHSQSLGNVLRIGRMNTGEREHQTQKPVEIMEALVDVCAPAGGVVLDPFMGSGTTLRAAKNRGRKAIGIERDEKFCEIAARRMGQEVLAIA